MSHDIESRADELAELMDEFRLEEARLSGGDWKIAFRKRPKMRLASTGSMPGAAAPETGEAADLEPIPDAAPRGFPISSPMTGIFYGAPSPSAPPFVKEGETVSAGQVVALIEAMKVFNEIVAPQSGIVQKIIAKSGDIVNPGEPLLYIG